MNFFKIFATLIAKEDAKVKFREAVTERIYELCEEYNYTPNRLAELSTVPPTTFRSLLSNNVANPSAYVIYKVCKTFKIELKDFFDSDLFKNLED